MSFTGNPRHPNNPPSDYPSEPTGPVAKDSLANESRVRGGAFGDNDNPEVLGVKGYQSTLNNEDTSNAEVLPPAASAADRQREEYADLPRKERGEAGGVRYPDANAPSGFDGTHSDQGFVGGSGDPSVASSGRTYDSSNVSSGGYAGNETGVRPYVESAPNYVADNTRGVQTDNELKPKGRNLVEGEGIPEDRDTYVGPIGGSNDPGRRAELEFAKSTADSSGGTGARDYSDTGRKGQGTAYDALDSSERA